ncbi:MAG: HEPN domain-containing protein [Pyrinomonadaceae bacterium]
MKAITQEWIDKAEGDRATLLREYRARKNPNYDAACFHAQQCAEKYFKARLQEAGIVFAKTHNLLHLLDSLLTIEPNWTNLQNSSAFLTVFAVKYRYPGSSSNKSEAKEAVKHCRLIRKTARQSFNLPIK